MRKAEHDRRREKGWRGGGGGVKTRERDGGEERWQSVERQREKEIKRNEKLMLGKYRKLLP